MKKIIYFLAALMALSVTSCNDDDVVFNPSEELDRLPMPMFRRKQNTNENEEGDRYATKLLPGYRNRIQLHWYGVEGASGYEIRYQEGGNARSEEDQWTGDNVKYITVGPDQLGDTITGLNYESSYVFCIRALSPKGEAHNSKWYGMGDGSHNGDYVIIPTEKRYTTPSLTDWRDKTYDGFTVMINPNFDESKYDKQDVDTINSRFNIVNGKLQFTHLVVKAHSANPGAVENPEYLDHELTPAELTPGEDGLIRVNVTGLSPSALYVVSLRDNGNTKAESEIDRYYTSITVRTKGDPGPDILIEHKVATQIWIDPDAETEPDMGVEQLWFDAERKYQACRLDTVISNFNNDITLAEGQTFLLEGGKAYYLRVGSNLCKGFTLRTDPTTLAEKGRAKVYLGGIYRDPSTGKCNGVNWQLGKAKEAGEFDAPINIEKIIFADIDFDCPEAINYGENLLLKAGTTDNYFANTLKAGLPVTFESFEMHNCTFQNIRRGFFRIQGSTKKVISHFVMDNNVFMNCGFRSDKGIDYNIIHGENENADENMFNLFEMTNNTFYDIPMGSICPTKNKIGNGFGANVHWNIRVENNTFINMCTRSDQALFNMREVPGDSKITFKNNLICLARDANDQRRLGFCGIDIRTIHGSTNIEFDIRDNYSAGCLPDHLVDDGIVTNKSYRFSATKNAPGLWPDCLGGNTTEDLKIHVGSTPLYTTDVFVDPNPRYHATTAQGDEKDPNIKNMHAIDPEEIWTRLKYTSDAKLLNHEIYLKNIGAQRWRSGDPKNFRIDF